MTETCSSRIISFGVFVLDSLAFDLQFRLRCSHYNCRRASRITISEDAQAPRQLEAAASAWWREADIQGLVSASSLIRAEIIRRPRLERIVVTGSIRAAVRCPAHLAFRSGLVGERI